MNFFKYYLGIIFLCVAAIIAARFLILTPETVALMYLDSKMYEEAMRRYEKMLAAGNRSGNVIIPLAKLYAQQGEIKRAVGLLVRYINRNPDLLNAEAVLSQIDKSATFLDEYGKLIERTPDFSSTNDVLLDLSSWYESVLQEQRQIEILAILAKLPDNKRTELNFNKLLTYYAVNSRFDGPSTFVRQLIINENPKESKKSFL
jgi:tetratricopeptide (TPR) repeat protein